MTDPFVEALKQKENRTPRVVELVELVLTTNLPQVCVLENLRETPSLRRVTSIEQGVMDAFTRNDSGTVQKYLADRTNTFYDSSSLHLDSSRPFASYAMAQFVLNLLAVNPRKTEWIKKVVHRNLLEGSYPQPLEPQKEENILRVYVGADPKAVKNSGNYVLVTPENIFFAHGELHQKYPNPDK
ncbi:MAG: hypothetical protein WC254_03685 [Candidatus Woesearchaeota archaeon]|jgi:hypothetical protein